MSNKIEVHYMGKSKSFSLDDIKVLWDPTVTWKEAIKNDPSEEYLYKFANLPTLYINFQGVKLPVSVTEEDFKK